MEHWRQRISIDRERMVGKPCLAGTRIPVYMILDKLGCGRSIDEVLDYPRLCREDVLVALHYGSSRIQGQWRCGPVYETIFGDDGRT